MLKNDDLNNSLAYIVIRAMTWKLYSDGGSRPNPGKAAYSAALYCGDELHASVGGFMGSSTNNKAEYKAFFSGLHLLEEHCATDDEIEVFLDSKLVLNQVQGIWKVKDDSLQSVCDSCKELLSSFTNVSMQWVKGHSGDPGNEYVDSVCTYFITKCETADEEIKQVNSDRIYLTCPYADKDSAKALGARWDAGHKKWYITADMDTDAFEKWI